MAFVPIMEWYALPDTRFPDVCFTVLTFHMLLEMTACFSSYIMFWAWVIKIIVSHGVVKAELILGGIYLLPIFFLATIKDGYGISNKPD